MSMRAKASGYDLTLLRVHIEATAKRAGENPRSVNGLAGASDQVVVEEEANNPEASRPECKL